MRETVQGNEKARRIRRSSLKQTLAVILTAILLSATIPGGVLHVAAVENTEAVSDSAAAPADGSTEAVSDSAAAPADDSVEADGPAAAAYDNTSDDAEADSTDLPADDAMEPDETVPEEPSEGHASGSRLWSHLPAARA